jgi:hypothetical protein
MLNLIGKTVLVLVSTAAIDGEASILFLVRVLGFFRSTMTLA